MKLALFLSLAAGAAALLAGGHARAQVSADIETQLQKMGRIVDPDCSA